MSVLGCNGGGLLSVTFVFLKCTTRLSSVSSLSLNVGGEGGFDRGLAFRGKGLTCCCSLSIIGVPPMGGSSDNGVPPRGGSSEWTLSVVIDMSADWFSVSSSDHDLVN